VVHLVVLIPIGFVLLIAAVVIAKGLHNDPAVQRFIARYPGVTSGKEAIGMPAWVEVG
jgi:methionine sulfoxide reductase catalytic subunit